MIRASSLRRRLIVGLGLAFIVVAAIPAWNSWGVFWRLRQARQHLAHGDPKLAIPPLEALVEAAPDRADVQYLLGVAQRRAGDVNLARPSLERARELGWPEADVARQERLLIVQTGQTRWAESLLQEAVQQDTPDEVAEEIYEALSVGYLLSYELLEASRCLDYWIAWRPEAIPPRLLKAIVAKRRQVSQEAMHDYEEILAIAPEHAETHLEYARLLLQGNRIQDAFAHFKYCSEVDPNEVEARMGLAECYNRMGQAEESRQLLQFVLDTTDSESHRAVALIELGKLAIASGEYAKAVDYLQEAVDIQPAETSSHYTLGTALAKMGRVEEARAAFARSKELRAKFDRIGNLHDQLLGDPVNSDARYEVGMILMDVGFTNQAVGWLRTVFLHDPNHRRTHEALLAYYEKEGLLDHVAAHKEALKNIDEEEAAKQTGQAPGSPANGGSDLSAGRGSSQIQAAPAQLPAGVP